jgi:ferrochelatase
VLFSAHGLPKRVVEKGDPYQWQVERTVAAVVARLAGASFEPIVCYQSKVGPLEWIGPATDAEIERAGRDGVAVVVVPIAFVSEHSETLVELDIEYRKLAEGCGVPSYARVATVGTEPRFIAGLAGLVRRALEGPAGLDSGSGGRLCPAACGGCPLKAGG